MIDERIVDKIRKLLALGSNNPESNEAGAALKKAAELAEMYGLSLADVDKTSGETKIERMTLATVNMRRYGMWMSPLAGKIAKIFDCHVVISADGGDYTFVGTPTDMQLAIWYFKLIRLKIIRQGKSKFKTIKEQKTYGWGAVLTVTERLEEMFVKTQENIRTADTKALVVVKNDTVVKKFHEMYPNLRTQKSKITLGSREAFEAGQQDGRRMGIHSGEVGRRKQTVIG